MDFTEAVEIIKNIIPRCSSEEYEKVKGILIDVKTLMSINVRQEKEEIKKLAKLIES